MPYWDHKRRRRKNCVSFFCDPYSHPQTVWKVSARVVKSVPLYRGDNEFSILGGGTFTLKTVSPSHCVTAPVGHGGKDSPNSLRSLRSESRGFFGLILGPSRKRNLYDIDSLAIIKSPLGQTNLRQSLIQLIIKALSATHSESTSGW